MIRALALLLLCVPACVGAPVVESAAQRSERLARACLDDDPSTCSEAAAQHLALPESARRPALLASLHYRACSVGDAAACGRAAELYADGSVAPPSRKKGRAIFEHMCRHAYPYDPGACTAGALFARACDGGVASSCAALAELEHSGRLGARRPHVARQLHGRACSAGHTPSCARVAAALAGSDPEGASKLFAMACQADDAAQCLALADLLSRGVGVDRDLPRARQLRQRACELGHGGGCFAAALMWQKGVGGERGQGNAKRLLDRACELDDADGCEALARGHAEGVFGKPDMARYYELSGKAAKRYEPACDAGDAHSCHMLGALHRLGGGVREDRTLGLALQQRACEAGYGLACIAWLTRGPHRVSFRGQSKMARAVSAACAAGDGASCFAVGWIGRADLVAAGATPPVHAFSRGCGAGHAPSCNAMAVASFPPTVAGAQALASACELGYAPACHHFAVANEMAMDVAADEAAVIAYARACSLGWMASCTRLGMMRQRGHITPGASSPRAAFEKACTGGDVDGCFELALVSRGPGMDPELAPRLLGRACDEGHAASCAELGISRLGEARADALTRLSTACERGAARACLVLADEVAEPARRNDLYHRAVHVATRACDDGLAVCGGDSTSRTHAVDWGVYEGWPARQLRHTPACGIALERACVVARDAWVQQCLRLDKDCFEGGTAIRRLAAAGLSVGVGAAVDVERHGVAQATAACRQGDAEACARLADAHRDGRGTDADARQAKRFRDRACQLDAARCTPP